MIVGLLNLYGPPALQQLVVSALTQSGLLHATDTLYYSGVVPPHPHSARVTEESQLFSCAKQYPEAEVWSFNVKEFSKGTPSDLDWCAYEVFFLITHWRQAIQTLRAGYQSYGVNLHSVPEPHYEGYCFWMTGAALGAAKLTQPYCAYHSFTNHYSSPYPASEYGDCDWDQSAPLSSRRLQERLGQLPSEQRDLASLLLLLVHAKHHYEFIPYHRSPRPHLVIDTDDRGALALGAPGIGRLDCTVPALVEPWLALGWRADFNLCEQVAGHSLDVVYTSRERVAQWLPLLAGQGVIVVRGVWSGDLPSQLVGQYTLIAREVEALSC
jgi:hypothetical protein